MNNSRLTNLCERIYSKIYSKDIRDHYLNVVIRDNRLPNILLFEVLIGLIHNGYYSLEEKYNLILDTYSVFDTIYSDYLEMYRGVISEWLWDKNNDYIYACHMIEAASIDDFDYCFDAFSNDNVLYGTSLKSIEDQIKFRTSVYYSNEYSFKLCYIDAIRIGSNMQNRVRFRADIINGELIITGFEPIASGVLVPRSTPNMYGKIRFPYNNGDKIRIQTPIMENPIEGYFYSSADKSPDTIKYYDEYYALMKSIDDDPNTCVKHICLSPGVVGYHLTQYLITDFITKI